MSYILEVIEDADQRVKFGKKDEEIEDTEPLLHIYEGYVTVYLSDTQIAFIDNSLF